VDHSPEQSEAVDLPAADYEAADVLFVTELEQLRALGDERRTRIVTLLRERARSISELAELLGQPKGTVGHHVKVLERSGLIRVVRTRQVRAVTERYYGRAARLFVMKSEDYPEHLRAAAAAGLRQAADEIRPGQEEETTFALLHARLTPDDAARFTRRLDRLVKELQAAETPGGTPHGFVVALYPTEPHS
jgi:DNA-binding transcriptional ArsR family regulator